MKKLISVVMILAMCLGLSLTAFASEENDVITIEEYMAALQEEAAKYGIEVELLEYHEDKVITREALENELESIRKYAESFKVESFSEGLEILEDLVESPAAGEDFTDMSVMRIMPVNKTVTKSFYLNNDYGNAWMCAEADVTIDVQSTNHIISVNRTSVYQNGSFTNFSSWQTTDISCTANSPFEGWMVMIVRGRITFRHTDPSTGNVIGHSSNVSKRFMIDCR